VCVSSPVVNRADYAAPGDEGAHPHQSVQRAWRLEAVHLAELRELERQVAIRLQVVLEDLHMARTVQPARRKKKRAKGNQGC
jgi:hypothetical protein